MSNRTSSSTRRPPFQTRTSSSLSTSRSGATADPATPQRNGVTKKSGPSLSLALNSPPLADGAANASSTIHPLKYTWDVHFSHRSANHKGKKDEQKNGPNGVQKEEWEEAVVKLGGFSSIESLHPFLAHLVPPSALPASLHSSYTLFQPNASEPAPAPVNVICDYNIFRSSIAPAWEDAANVGGGRWVLRLRKGVADRVWEEVVYALVGERIGGEDERAGDKINGVVLSVRKDEDILSLWVAPSNRTERDVIRDSLRAVLQPLLTSTSAANLQLDYKPHPVVGGTPGANGQASRLVDLSGNSTDSPSSGRPHHHSHRSYRQGGEDDASSTPNGNPSRRFDRSRDSTPIGSGRISSPSLAAALAPLGSSSSSRGPGFSSYVSRNSESVERRGSGIESPFFNRSRESSPAPSALGGGGVGVIGGGLFGRTRSQRGEQRDHSSAGREDGAERSSATSWGRI
ncbi:hypothetical protein JCM10212_002040 [Sporobolomyces blumeae]